MENTFDLKKFLVENKLTKNSRLISEEQTTYGADPDRPYHVSADGPIKPGLKLSATTEIANNLKKIKSTAEATINTAKRALQDQETYAGIDREGIKNPQAVEQQIEVVEDALDNIEDYAGDGWAVDIEDIAREKSIPELQMMLKTLIEETDELENALTGQPIQELALNEGWKNWALGAISALSVLGGGTAQAATGTDAGIGKPGTETSVQQGNFDKSWETVKSGLTSTNPKLIVSKDFDTGLPFQSLNWGTAAKGAGKAKGGMSIVHNKGSKTIELTFFSETNPEVREQFLLAAKKAGIQLTSQGRGAAATIPVEQAAKVVAFIKATTPILQGTPDQVKVSTYGGVGNTGPVQSGPAYNKQGSVSIK